MISSAFYLNGNRLKAGHLLRAPTTLPLSLPGAWRTLNPCHQVHRTAGDGYARALFSVYLCSSHSFL